MNNELCSKCNLPIGSNELECENCYYYNDYHSDEYHDKQFTKRWEGILEHLWRLQDNE